MKSSSYGRRLLANPLFALVMIVVTASAIYGNVYENPFVFDGKIQIEDNMKIRNFNNYLTLRSFFSHRPLTDFSFALNYRFGKLETFGYHLVNVLIHMINGMLAYLLARCIFKRLSLLGSRKQDSLRYGGQEPDQRKSGPLDDPMTRQTMALLTALIFVAHPIQTQAVTYTVQRYSSMSAMFYLGSLLFYIWARRLQIGQMTKAATKPGFGEHTGKGIGRLHFKIFCCFFSFVLFGILAFLCKENAATLFGVVLLTEFFLFDRTWSGWRKKLIWIVPITCVSIAAILYVFASTRGLRFGNLLEDVSILTRETRSIGRFSYLCTQFSAFVMYVRLLFFPVGQNIDYMMPFKTGFFDGYTPLAFLFVLFVLAVGFWNIKKRSAVGFGIFWVFITLSVESSIFPISDAIFEHRLYLPMLGFSIALVGGVFDLFRNRTVWAVAILAVFFFLLSIGTYLRNGVWKDPKVLWSDVISKSPHNYRAHYNLGNEMQRSGQFDESQAHYEKAIGIYPNFAVAHENLGLALMEKGRFSEAYQHLEKAVRLNPRDANTQNNFGQLLLSQGRIKEAVKHFSLAVRINPRFSKAQNNLGIAFAQQNDLKNANKHLSKAARLDPDNPAIQNNLGQVFMLQGNYNQAARHFERAVELNPEFAEARMNLGFMRLEQERPNEAVKHFSEALRIDPGNTRARQGLDRAAKAQGGLGPRR